MTTTDEACAKCGEPRLTATTGLHAVTVAGHTFHAALPAHACGECGGRYVAGETLERFELATAAALLAGGETRGEALRFVRKTLALRATDLADLLGVAAESVSRWEHDARTPEHAVVALLAVLVDEARRGGSAARDCVAALRSPTALGATVTLDLAAIG
jgi:putative zinc finger/helix-turn-helix YgiT family protein